MLNQLISRFFSKQDAQQSIESRLSEQWADWLLPISPEKPAGEDLTYHDNFQEIKEEVAKLSGVDYPLIVRISEDILKQNSKDIRVATYYCLARLQVDGASGFADGLELLAGLLQKFGLTLYPSRSNIRKNAIEWLASAKFTDILNKLQPIAEVNLTRIVAALNLINDCNQALFHNDNATESSIPNLDALIQFFANSIKQPVKIESSRAIQPDAQQQETLLPTSQNKSDFTISSQRDLLEQARRMAAYLREKPSGYLAAGRMLRALRWDIIDQLPPMDHRGKTRLPAPRTEVRQNINRLIISQQWDELFERVEAAFMEGANHFWLDLQRAAVLALHKKGGDFQRWAEIFLTDVGLFLERLPGIEQLTFDNGVPFADADTLQWIETQAKIHHLDEDTSLVPIIVSGDNDWNEIEKQALELAESGGLEKAFVWLQNLPTIRLPKQIFLLQYTQARIAEQAGKVEIAYKLLVGLDNKQHDIHLSEWEPTLIFDIKQQLIRLIKQKIQHKDSDRTLLMNEIERLQQELVYLDPARAITVIG